MSRGKKGSPPCRLLLTERALQDIRAIEGYSAEQWGNEVAQKYVDKIETALDRIVEQPDLLREEPDFADSLRFHRVEKHVLVCDIQGESVYVLTVLHTSMDIPGRLAKLQPQLSLEARLLHRRVAARNQRER